MLDDFDTDTKRGLVHSCRRIQASPDAKRLEASPDTLRAPPRRLLQLGDAWPLTETSMPLKESNKQTKHTHRRTGAGGNARQRMQPPTPCRLPLSPIRLSHSKRGAGLESRRWGAGNTPGGGRACIRLSCNMLHELPSPPPSPPFLSLDSCRKLTHIHRTY